MLIISCEIAFKRMIQDLIGDKSTLVQVITWWQQAFTCVNVTQIYVPYSIEN